MLRAPDGSPALMRIEPQRSALVGLGDWLDHRFRVLALSDKVAYAVRLCVEEAVLNVIDHARPSGPRAAITVWVGHCAGRLSGCIKDRGPAFDPLQVAPPPRATELASASIGGMGIPLMRAFADEIAYRRGTLANRLLFRFAG